MLRRLKAIEGQDLSYEQRKADEKVVFVRKTCELTCVVDFAVGEHS